MIIHHDPDAWVAESEFRACAFHRDNPTGHWAGCTCAGSAGLRPATPEERAANRRRRLEAERETLTRRLRAIEAEIGGAE